MEEQALAENALAERWRSIRGPDRFRQHPRGYVREIKDNLVDGVNPADFEGDLKRAAGKELEERNGEPPKFCASYSSSALVVNCFAPFRSPIHCADLKLLGQQQFDSLCFEKELPTGLAGHSPSLDVLCHGPTNVAIESKCVEYLQPSKHSRMPFAPSYEELVLKLFEKPWEAVYRELKENHDAFAPLDAAQLVKHYLGIRHNGRPTILLYLFWEPTNAQKHRGIQAHRNVIRKFERSVAGSEVPFAAKSYSELWNELLRETPAPWVVDHIGRLRQRYEVAI